jgi:DNA-binding Lrp family transcriptional regulator
MSIEDIHPYQTQAASQHKLHTLLNRFQQDFPLSPEPYADIAAQLEMSEDSLLELLSQLSDRGILSRVGAVFRPHRVGVSTLAAMAVPPARLEMVADRISAWAAVNHNYEREHHFNLWFVVTAETPEQLQDILQQMELDIGIRILSLPMEQEYHINLGFPLQLLRGKDHD